MPEIKQIAGKTGVHVYIRVNHSDKELKLRLIDGWHDYVGEPDGMQILKWVVIPETKPISIDIPVGGITISSAFKDQIDAGASRRYRNQNEYRNKFSVTISRGGNIEQFDFTGSIHDADRGIVSLTSNEMIYAFYCFVQDAIAGTQPFREFMADFGYDDCCEGYRVWKACQNATIQATRLGLGDLYELLNKLQEDHPEAM